MKLKEMALLVNGRVDGDGELEIASAAGLEEAGAGQVSFYANPKYRTLLSKTAASAVVLKDTEKYGDVNASKLYVSNVYYAMAVILEKLYPQQCSEKGVHKTSVIGRNVKLPENVHIGANVVVCDSAVIGEGTEIRAGSFVGRGTVIGRNSTIYPNVALYGGIKIGNNVIIHSGTVIGSDGFGYATTGGKHRKLPQIGTVIVEDDVEIGANVTIDRAATGQTLIGAGTKIDNLVMIAHNVKIGKNCLIVAQTGISGSTVIGNNVTLAGQSGIAGHLRIGDNAVVAAQAGVTKDVPPARIVSGYPAREHSKAKQINAYVSRLHKLYAEVKEIRNILKKGDHGKTKND